MSYCEIITFKNDEPDHSVQFRNAWGGGFYIWNNLFEKYLKDDRKPHDCVLDKDNLQRLWDLQKRADLPDFQRAVLISTFDYAVVFQAELEQFVCDLAEFANCFGYGRREICHLPDWAAAIRKTLGVQAVGFYQTSVADNLWWEYDEDTDESTPYNLARGDRHIDVYKHLTDLKEHKAAEDEGEKVKARAGRQKESQDAH